jgi:hypothetical protein
MDIPEIFLLTSQLRKAAEALWLLSMEIAASGRRAYPQASWQPPSPPGEERLLSPLEDLQRNAERLLHVLKELEAPPQGPPQRETASLTRKIEGFIHLCQALREQITTSPPPASLDAPYGAGAPKGPPPAVSAVMAVESARRLADDITSLLLWQANVAGRRDI